MAVVGILYDQTGKGKSKMATNKYTVIGLSKLDVYDSQFSLTTLVFRNEQVNEAVFNSAHCVSYAALRQ